MRLRLTWLKTENSPMLKKNTTINKIYMKCITNNFISILKHLHKELCFKSCLTIKPNQSTLKFSL